jgi:hypothetical protein
MNHCQTNNLHSDMHAIIMLGACGYILAQGGMAEVGVHYLEVANQAVAVLMELAAASSRPVILVRQLLGLLGLFRHPSHAPFSMNMG